MQGVEAFALCCASERRNTERCPLGNSFPRATGAHKVPISITIAGCFLIRRTMSVLPDVLVPGLAVVFCGTAVGTASALRRAYYAGRGNGFWQTLAEVGLTPRRIEPEEYQCITDFGLGLTDLAKTISGADDVLSNEHFGRGELHAKVLQYKPKVLAFTSKRAAQEFLGHPVPYGLLDEKIDDTLLFVLPSPSGTARRHWDLKPWRDLARLRSDAEPSVAADAPRAACR